MPKNCVVCGCDVSQARRVKDPRGNYYCQPCHTQRRAATAPAASVAKRAAPARSAADGTLDFAEPASTSAAARATEPMVACCECKKLVPQRAARFEDGAFICTSCVRRHNANVRGPMAKPQLVDAEAAHDGVPFVHTIPGMIVALGGTIAVTVILLVMVLLFKGETPLVAGVAAGLLFGYCAVLTALILVAMSITGAIFGGFEFGNPATALARALGIVAADLIISLALRAAFGPVASIYRFARILLITGALMFLFRVEWMEGLVVAIAYWMLTWFGLLVLVMLMMSVGNSLRPSSSPMTFTGPSTTTMPGALPTGTPAGLPGGMRSAPAGVAK